MNWLLALLILLPATTSEAAYRSTKARVDYAKANTCPSTQKKRLPCPGYVIDRKIPLCAGGKDAPFNMVWQEKRESLVKDREELRWCREIRAKRMPAYTGDACEIIKKRTMPLLWNASCETGMTR